MYRVPRAEFAFEPIMKFMYAYLDESGNLPPDKNKYFIVGLFTTENPRQVAKAYRKWQKTKMPRKVRGQTEVKFSDSSINDDVRLKTIKFISSLQIKIFYSYISGSETFHKNKYYRKKSGLIYAQVVAETLEMLGMQTEGLTLARDQRILSGISIREFNEHVRDHIKATQWSLQIEAIDSTTSSLIQIADWICGGLARYHEKKHMGEEIFLILKRNIVETKKISIAKEPGC